MAHPLAKLVVETVRLIAKDVGHGSDSSVIMIQRVARRVHEGKVSAAELTAVSDMIDRVEDGGAPPVESIVDELVPVLRRRLQSNAILMANDDWARRGDFSTVMNTFEKARRLGEAEVLKGTRLGPAGFEPIELAKTVERLATGVLELDVQLNQGLAHRQLGVWIGGPGGGKSMALATQVAECIRQQMFVGFVTLELPESVQLARLYANLTGIPTNLILDNDQDREEAKRRIASVEHVIGLCEVAEFAPHATTVKDLIDWVDSKEQEHGVKMQCLVIDYADKLQAPQVRDNNEYVAMRYVYEGLRRDVAVERNMWVWTGSQASRATKDSNKRLDMEHAADSMHKVRVPDLVLTLNPKEDTTMEIFVAKNRMGKSRFSVGPFVTDFERARLVPVARELGPW